jgi:hypothetical protein
VHTISAERATKFMDDTNRHANIMCDMLDKLKEHGLSSTIVTTSATAA